MVEISTLPVRHGGLGNRAMCSWHQPDDTVRSNTSMANDASCSAILNYHFKNYRAHINSPISAVNTVNCNDFDIVVHMNLI